MPQDILYLQNGEKPNRSNTTLTSYRSNKPHYCLSNYHTNKGNGFTFNDPDVGQVHFKSAEVYLHFQKFDKATKDQLKDTWEKIDSDQARTKNRSGIQIYSVVESGITKKVTHNLNYTFDSNEWDKKLLKVQQQINLTKYQQSQEFRDSIHRSIDAGQSLNDGKGALQIIEDTSTANYIEDKWGTGPQGEGTNILGNTQTAFANAIHQNHVGINTPATFKKSNPKELDQLYKDAQSNYKSEFQKSFRLERYETIGLKCN